MLNIEANKNMDGNRWLHAPKLGQTKTDGHLQTQNEDDA